MIGFDIIDAFGSSGSFNAELLYAGEYFDSETGLYFTGPRYYDPSIDRFITEDSSSSGSEKDPISTNKYVYADDNPMSMSDPTGNYAAYNNGNGIESVGSSSYDATQITKVLPASQPAPQIA